jgi:arginase
MSSSIQYKYYPTKKATIITAPFSGGQPKGGVELGPEYILKAGFQKQIESLGWATDIVHPLQGTDYERMKSNEKDSFGVKNTKIVNDSCQKIHESVKESLKDHKLPITIGGDHSIGTATISASLVNNPETCIIWVDAHADINTPKTTDLGNLHGCPVSFVMGIDRESYPPEYSWVPQLLKANKLVYIGLRDVDDAEKEILRKYNIPAFSMYHVDKYGIGKVVEMALDKVNPNRDCPIHLSYDVDAIDPSFVPATGTRVEGGLSLREGLFVAEEIAQTGLLCSLDIVETNPMLAETEEHVLDTVSAACAIGRCALGQTLL